MNILDGGTKKRFEDLLVSERRQTEALNEELAEVEREGIARTEKLNERVKESKTALENLRNKQDAERRAKEKEIETEKLKDAKKIEDLENAYFKKRAEADNQSMENLRDLQLSYEKEKNKLLAAQEISLGRSSKELADLQAAHHADMEVAQQECRNIIQEREENLRKHDKKKEQTMEEHNKKYRDESNELLRIKKEVLEKKRILMKEELEKKMEILKKELTIQAAQMNSECEKELVAALSTMLNPFIKSIAACKELKSSFEDLETKVDISLFAIKTNNKDWIEYNNHTKIAANVLRQKINNYTTINSVFRDEVKSAMIDIERDAQNNNTLQSNIMRKVANRQIRELQLLLPQIEEKVDQLEQMAETAKRICAPHNDVIQKTLCSGSTQSSNQKINN